MLIPRDNPNQLSGVGNLPNNPTSIGGMITQHLDSGPTGTGLHLPYPGQSIAQNMGAIGPGMNLMAMGSIAAILGHLLNGDQSK